MSLLSSIAFVPSKPSPNSGVTVSSWDSTLESGVATSLVSPPSPSPADSQFPSQIAHNPPFSTRSSQSSELLRSIAGFGSASSQTVRISSPTSDVALASSHSVHVQRSSRASPPKNQSPPKHVTLLHDLQLHHVLDPMPSVHVSLTKQCPSSSTSSQSSPDKQQHSHESLASEPTLVESRVHLAEPKQSNPQLPTCSLASLLQLGLSSTSSVNSSVNSSPASSSLQTTVVASHESGFFFFLFIFSQSVDE
jgi:hypothetical protein